MQGDVAPPIAWHSNGSALLWAKWGWAVSCSRMMSSVTLPCLFLTVVSSMHLSPKYYRNKQCNQYDHKYALGFLTTLNSKAKDKAVPVHTLDRGSRGIAPINGSKYYSH